MLYNADCIEILKTLKPNSIDLIFADPPYFLSNGGKSIHSGKIVSVNKGDWDDKSKYDNHLQFTKEWLQQSFRVLKYGGSIWISGTVHNIFDVKNYLDITPVQNHIVEAGENPGSIAKKYKVSTMRLLDANNMKSTDVIHVGDTLKIPEVYTVKNVKNTDWCFRKI